MSLQIQPIEPFMTPETLSNYEVGFKTTFWENRARLNVAAYHMVWNDLQAEVFQGPGGSGGVRDNVGDAHSTGVDFEFFLIPVKGLTWNIGGSYLEAQTDDDFSIDGDIIPAGTAIPNVSEFSFNTALQYNFRLTEKLWAFARASYSYTGPAHALNLSSDFDTPEYEIVNVRAGIEQENWQLTVFVDNMLDEHIKYMYGGELATDLFCRCSVFRCR